MQNIRSDLKERLDVAHSGVVKHFESFEALWKAKPGSAFCERCASGGKPGFDAVHITH